MNWGKGRRNQYVLRVEGAVLHIRAFGVGRKRRFRGFIGHRVFCEKRKLYEAKAFLLARYGEKRNEYCRESTESTESTET